HRSRARRGAQAQAEAARGDARHRQAPDRPGAHAVEPRDFALGDLAVEHDFLHRIHELAAADRGRVAVFGNVRVPGKMVTTNDRICCYPISTATHRLPDGARLKAIGRRRRCSTEPRSPAHAPPRRTPHGPPPGNYHVSSDDSHTSPVFVTSWVCLV